MQRNVAVALLQDIEANVTSKRMIHDEIVAKIKVKVKCSGILECWLPSQTVHSHPLHFSAVVLVSNTLVALCGCDDCRRRPRAELGL